MQKRRNSSALAMELRLFCIKPSIWRKQRWKICELSWCLFMTSVAFSQPSLHHAYIMEAAVGRFSFRPIFHQYGYLRDKLPTTRVVRVEAGWWWPMDTRWRHQMETFSALVALCAENSPVSGEFPAQMPVTRSCNVYFDLRLIKRLSKHSRGWWFERLTRPL